jgi:hypothetical protein
MKSEIKLYQHYTHEDSRTTILFLTGVCFSDITAWWVRYLCAYNGHECRTSRGLFLSYTLEVTFFLGKLTFLRTVYCSQVSAERAVFLG